MLVTQAADAPSTLASSWEDRWHGPDCGLIAAWQAGRDLALLRADLVAACVANELPELPWKGNGRLLKRRVPRYGPFHYVAMWQGLRGDDLHIDTSIDLRRVCARTGQAVIYTSRSAAWAGAEDSLDNVAD